MKFRCLWSGHEWYTSKVVGAVTESWRDVPPFVFERGGHIVSAPPCRVCGAENPEAFGERDGAYFYRVTRA